MTFQSKNGAYYRVLNTGVIEQVNPQPYKYDAKYVATYDTPEYVRGNETLQAMRYAFATAAHRTPISSILDVGCANGAFLKFVQKQIYYCYGYDVTGEQVEGVAIVKELIPAEVYTFHDVLEHIHDCSFLADLQCDTICISLPYCHYHTVAKGQEWFDNEYKHLKRDEHVRHFNPVSLRYFMEGYGWRMVALSLHEDIVRKSTHGLPNIISAAFKRI